MKLTVSEINQARHLMTPGTAEILLDYADPGPAQSTAPTACATTDAKFWEQIQADRRARGLPPLSASDVAGSVHTPASTTHRSAPPAAGPEVTGLGRTVNAFRREAGKPALSAEEFARISG